MSTRNDLDKIFEEVMQLPAAEREAFLEHACLGKSELRRKLEVLIAHSNQHPPDEFMKPEKLSDLIKDR